jgi:hypothetical protein
VDAHHDPVDHTAQHERFALGVALWEAAKLKAAAAGVAIPDRLARGATEALADAQTYGEIVARGSSRAEVLASARETEPIFDGLDDAQFAEAVADLENLQGYPVSAESVLASRLETIGDDLAWHADQLDQFLPDDAADDAVDDEADRRYARWARLNPAPTDRIPEGRVEARRWWAERLRHDRQYVEIRSRVRCEFGRWLHEPRSRVPMAASRPREHRSVRRSSTRAGPTRRRRPPEDDPEPPDLAAALLRRLGGGRP